MLLMAAAMGHLPVVRRLPRVGRRRGGEQRRRDGVAATHAHKSPSSAPSSSTARARAAPALQFAERHDGAGRRSASACRRRGLYRLAALLRGGGRNSTAASAANAAPSQARANSLPPLPAAPPPRPPPSRTPPSPASTPLPHLLLLTLPPPLPASRSK